MSGMKEYINITTMSGHKRLIALDEIKSIFNERNGKALIETQTNDGSEYLFETMESFYEIIVKIEKSWRKQEGNPRVQQDPRQQKGSMKKTAIELTRIEIGELPGRIGENIAKKSKVFSDSEIEKAIAAIIEYLTTKKLKS